MIYINIESIVGTIVWGMIWGQRWLWSPNSKWFWTQKQGRATLHWISLHAMEVDLKWNPARNEIFSHIWKSWISRTKISCWHRFDHSPHGQKREKAFHTVCNFMDITLCQNRMLFEMEVTMKQRRRNSIWQRWKMAVVSFFSGGWMLSFGREILSAFLSPNWTPDWGRSLIIRLRRNFSRFCLLVVS